MSDTPTGNSGNNRVSNAILRTEMTHLRGDLDAFRTEWRDWCREHNLDHKGADAERKDMAGRITRNEERLRNTTGILGVFQVIGSAAAVAISQALGK